MFKFPDTEKSLKSRISTYKSALNKEKKNHGYINDGGGKRYLLFCLYFVLNDLKKSQNYIEWYKNEFTDDIGEPIQKLCWTLILHRLEKGNEAKHMLAKLMLSNLYLIPKLIGQDVEKYDIWHSSNYEHIEYVHYVPEEVIVNIQHTEIQWMKELYYSFEFRRIRKQYIEVYYKLQYSKDIEERKSLLSETRALLKNFH